MGTIDNTSTDSASLALVLLDAMSGGTGAIEAMEKRGQQQLVNSDRLPTDLGSFNGSTDSDYTALGFTFGQPDEADPLFRPATLPDGWKREGSGHDMWSYVVDQHGRRRVAIFYKAAFYDRHSFMRLVSFGEYLRTAFAEGGEVLLDDWLTTEHARIAATEIRDRAQADADQADGFAERETPIGPAYWLERAARRRADAAKAQAFIDGLS